MRKLVAIAMLAAALGGGAALWQASPTSAAGSTTVVMDHLNNPRHVHVAADGSIYVAEAGKGGSHCSGPRRDKTCIGFTSAVSRYANGTQQRIVTGLVSAAGKDGSFAVGADDVAVDASGSLFSIETSAGRHTGLPRVYTKQLGRLLATSPAGTRRT
ncbi:MAG: ScyD/ScyE family protein, partial [Actinomycetota bacterium]